MNIEQKIFYLSIAFCAFNWGIGAIFFSYAQYKEAKSWLDDDDDDWWKKESKQDDRD
mgnify:CR=1 FL=1